MKAKKLDQEILETIQKIGAIFESKNIASVPIDISTPVEKIDPGTERIVIIELLIHLESITKQYYKKFKKKHKYQRYIYHFYQILDDNTNEKTLVSKRRQNYG